MNILTIKNLDQLCYGAALLGSGGGGDPDVLKDYMHYLLNLHGPVKIITTTEMELDALVVPIALIGAPLISIERIPNAKMFINLFDKIQSVFANKKIILMPVEIGGCNAMTPFILASMYSLPVLDADLIGRAFPKINMCKPAIMGMTQQTAFIASALGEVVCIEAETMAELEDKARTVATAFGCSAAITTFIFEANQYKNYVIEGSISRALELGQSSQHIEGASIIGTGIITDVHHAIENGFLKGYVKICSKQHEFMVFFQNEYLLVTKSNQKIAESPTIISLIESRSRKAITSESLRFGLQVDLVTLIPPDFWLTPKASSQVSLRVFGYELNDAGLLYV